VAVVSISEAARSLGLDDHRQVSVLVKLARIEPVSHPSNARASGLTVEHMARLRAGIDALRGPSPRHNPKRSA
jgi:hypothetical protein